MLFDHKHTLVMLQITMHLNAEPASSAAFAIRIKLIRPFHFELGIRISPDAYSVVLCELKLMAYYGHEEVLCVTSGSRGDVTA